MNATYAETMIYLAKILKYYRIRKRIQKREAEFILESSGLIYINFHFHSTFILYKCTLFLAKLVILVEKRMIDINKYFKLIS